jgi:hypothetical protein
MPRLKETSAALLEINLPVAIAAGWTVKELATACHCGERAAGEALARYRQVMRERMARESGGELEAMRGAAQAARRATIARAVRSGELADSIHAEGRALLDGLDCTGTGLQRVGGPEGGEDAPKGDALARLALLERVANILAKAVKTAEVSWNLCRSASGLAIAERLSEAKARESIKGKGKPVDADVWEADFTLLPMD